MTAFGRLVVVDMGWFFPLSRMMNEMVLLCGGRREGKGRPAATAKGRSEMEGRERGIRNLGSNGSGSRKQVRPGLVGARNSGKYLASKLIRTRYNRRGTGGRVVLHECGEAGPGGPGLV